MLLAFILKPGVTGAQNKEPVPAENSSEEKRKAEEARWKAMAEAEAMRKKQAEEEARRKAAMEKLLKENTGSAAGFQLLKIPVAGPYYLGMRQREYDSITIQNPSGLTTGDLKYTLKQTPNYFAGRLYMLSFSMPDSIFSADLSDITTYFEYRLGAPDEKKTTDFLAVFPNEEDHSLQGEFRIKKAVITWQYQYHTAGINYCLIDMKNGSWKGFYLIRYAGTVEYVKGLAKLEEMEKRNAAGN